MTNRILRWLVSGASRWTGLLASAERSMRGTLTILCYHRVLPEDARSRYFAAQLVVTPEVLRHHCCALQSRYDVLPLAEAVSRWSSGVDHGRPLAAMTFDDGYRDNHCYAAPILAERGLRATFFVITDLVGSPLAPWYDRLVRGWARSVRLPGGPPTDAMKLLRPDDLRRCRLSGPPTPRQVVSQAKSLPPSVRAELLRRVESHAGPDEAQDVDQIMGWSELSSLAAAGHEIGSHSATHPILTQLDEPALMHEIHGSRSCLAERLGKPVVSFCYPNGDLDDRVVQAVSSAGYRYAVTTRSAINTPGANPHRLARRFIDQDRLSSLGGAPSATLFQAELSGVIDLLFLRHLRACRT